MHSLLKKSSDNKIKLIDLNLLLKIIKSVIKKLHVVQLIGWLTLKLWLTKFFLLKSKRL